MIGIWKPRISLTCGGSILLALALCAAVVPSSFAQRKQDQGKVEKGRLASLRAAVRLIFYIDQSNGLEAR